MLHRASAEGPGYVPRHPFSLLRPGINALLRALKKGVLESDLQSQGIRKGCCWERILVHEVCKQPLISTKESSRRRFLRVSRGTFRSGVYDYPPVRVIPGTFGPYTVDLTQRHVYYLAF